MTKLVDLVPYLVTAQVLLSWVAEFVPFYQRLNPERKRLSMYVVAGALAVGSWALVVYTPPSLLTQLQFPAYIVALVIAGIGINQGTHALAKVNQAKQLK